MAEKELQLKEKVEYSGVFDFQGLYQYSHSWFKEAEYGVDEEEYIEKLKGNKKDIEVKWKAMKDVSDYFKFEHVIKFEIKEMGDVEAEINGKKRRMNQGKIKIDITGALIKDKDSKWDTAPFYRFMRDVYNKYIIPSRINELKNELGDDVRNFKEEIKAFLELAGRR
jgi:hypothetical protein